MRTREEHLQWCKDRALSYLNAGSLRDAFASMTSDMNKHEETKGVNQAVGHLGFLYVLNHDRDGMRRWIKGFR